MKLDYATLISPFPLRLEKVGRIKSPKLKEIWDTDVTFIKYDMFLSLFLVDAQTYCNSILHEVDDDIKELNMFDLLSEDENLSKQFESALNFFFVENVIWDSVNKVFFTYVDTDENGKIIPLGIIHKGIWDELCDVILQLNNIKRANQEKKLKFKSKIAQEIWELTHSKDKKESKNSDVELPNIISSVAAMSESLNMINIWDLTVYQIYDQFQRLQRNEFYEISARSVSTWGDEKNKFDSGAWYHNLHET